MRAAASQGIIEGVTGAGKTRTIDAFVSGKFARSRWSPHDLFSEEQTFGEFMAELRDEPSAPPAYKFRALTQAVGTAQQRATKYDAYRFILERAHYSYYALLPQWDYYKAFDETLSALRAHTFLLWIPDGRLKRRSLHRADRHGWGDGFIDLYGSELAALNAIRSSQDARYEAIRKSAIPHTVIDTTAMAWQSYADQIIAKVAATHNDP